MINLSNLMIENELWVLKCDWGVTSDEGKSKHGRSPLSATNIVPQGVSGHESLDSIKLLRAINSLKYVSWNPSSHQPKLRMAHNDSPSSLKPQGIGKSSVIGSAANIIFPPSLSRFNKPGIKFWWSAQWWKDSKNIIASHFCFSWCAIWKSAWRSSISRPIASGHLEKRAFY